MHATLRFTALCVFLSLGCNLSHTSGAVPGVMNYQGRVTVNGTNYCGTGWFRFALLKGADGPACWSNGVDAVSVPVDKGLCAVLLGDTGVANMAPIPAGVFTNSDVRLRVWFDDGANGVRQLSPDHRVAAAGYAMMAADVPDGVVTSNKLAAGAVRTAHLGAGSVGRPQIAVELSNALVPWVVSAGASQAADPNTAYLLTGAGQQAVTLPASPNPGDVVAVSAGGAGGWAVLPGAGQTVAGVNAPIGTVWTQHASTRNWSAIGCSSNGQHVVAAAYAGALYISADGGATWALREGGVDWGQQWRSVALSSDGARMVAVGQNARIRVSADYGASWSQADSERFWVSVASSSDGARLVAAVFGGRLYTSDNAGATWTPRENVRNWDEVASSADGSKLVAVVNGGRIYTSGDFGLTWTQRGDSRNWLSVASSADGTKLAAAANGAGIFVSTDSGATWTPRADARNWNAVTCSGDGARVVAAAGGDRVFISTDGGVNWTPSESARNWNAVAAASDGNTFLAAAWPGQVYRSVATLTGVQGTMVRLQYAGGGVWQPLRESQIGAGSVGSAQLAADLAVAGCLTAGCLRGNGALPWATVQGAALTATPNTAYLAVGASRSTVTLPATANTGDIVRVSGGGGGGWLMQSLWKPWDADRNWVMLAPSGDGSRIAAACWPGFLYTSADSGVTWTARDASRQWSAIASSSDGRRLAAVEYQGGIYTSADYGATWSLSPEYGDWMSIASSADGMKLVASRRDGPVLTSSDGGATWVPRSISGDFYSVASSADGAKLVALNRGGRIYVSTDSGASWTARESNRNWQCVASSADGVRLAATVDGGQIYVSADSGLSWAAREANGSRRGIVSSADGQTLLTCVAGGQLSLSVDAGVTWTAQENSRSWQTVAVSADARRLFAAPYGGRVYACIAMAGAQGASATAQYMGNGDWQALAETQVAPNCVGASQLIAGAVGSAQLAPNLTVSGTVTSSFAGNGGGLTNVNANLLDGLDSTSFAPAASSTSYIQNQTAIAQAAGFRISGNGIIGGSVGIGTNAPASALEVNGTITAKGLVANGPARATGLLRSGTETGNSEAPSPAGQVIRRINSSNMAVGQVVARTDTMTLVRDGTPGGFAVNWAAGPGVIAIASTGINAAGAPVSYYAAPSPAAPGSVAIYNNGVGVTHFQCFFGGTAPGQHFTEVTLTRVVSDGNWVGTLRSTFNQ